MSVIIPPILEELERHKQMTETPRKGQTDLSMNLVDHLPLQQFESGISFIWSIKT